MHRLLGLLAMGIAGVASAQDRSPQYYEYRALIENLQEEWVVVSNHFRHSDNCTLYGCIIIGPTDDQDACEEWAKLYNRNDPYDHVRCVSAQNYTLRDY